MTRTVWLASYPKSGNTWFRIFLCNLFYPEQAPIDLNKMPLSTIIASTRVLFDRELGVASTLLSHDEIEALRPEAHRMAARSSREPLFFRKAHDAYTYLPSGKPVMGDQNDACALYFMRHPCDVAVSAAYHWGCTIDESVERLLSPNLILSHPENGVHAQLPQRQLTWAQHVISWMQAPLQKHLMRYESMVQEPLVTFRSALQFLSLEYDDDAILKALEASRFERLQDQEQKQRFQETHRNAGSFFRSGRVGEGVKVIRPELAEGLLAEWEAVEKALLNIQGATNEYVE